MAGSRDLLSFRPILEALLQEAHGAMSLCAPAVGVWRDMPAPGALIAPGSELGRLEILGVSHLLRAPEGAYGIADWPTDPSDEPTSHPVGDLTRRPVQYGQILLHLDPEKLAAGTWTHEERSRPDELADGQLGFHAPMSGRFYSRPAPDKPPFVKPGDEVHTGSTVGLLEVMKTFNRLSYGGDDLPERARVTAVVPEDESDLSAGDVILYLEPVE